MYINELLSIQQKRSVTKSKRKIFSRKSTWVILKKKEAIKEKSKSWCKNSSKRQVQQVSKRKISAINLVQKRSVTKWISFVLPIVRMSAKTLKFDNIRLNKI